MKLASYVTLSATAMMAMVYYAYYTRKQFYPTVLFLVSSKLSFIIACNLVLAVSLVAAKFIKSLYFGNLREAEVEVLMEKAKFAVVETALALTIFRNELTTFTLALFGALILTKLLHKLSKCRLEYLEQISPVSRYVQLRMTLLLLSLMLIDSVGIAFAVYQIMQRGKSVLILFGFEFGLLLIYAFNLKIRFIIQAIDNMLVNGLQSRGLCIMIVDLLCDVIKVVTYIAFFSLIFLYYGLPFHLIRDLWATLFSFQRKFFSFIKYLQLSRNLDSRFPDATPEEIGHAGNCLVCREDMDRGKKLPCGHVFHLDCLRIWLQHQQTCPLCRADIPTSGDAAAPTPLQPPAANPQDQNIPPEARAQMEGNDEPGADFAAELPPSPPGTPERLRLQALRVRERALESAAKKPRSPMTSKIMPSMYVSLEEINVYSEPVQTSDIVRSIKKGTVMFVTLRVSADNVCWLKLVDGWVMEELRSSIGSKLLISPLCKTSDSVEGKQSKEQIGEAHSERTHNAVVTEKRVYNRKHFLSRFDSQAESSSGRSNNYSDVNMERSNVSELSGSNNGRPMGRLEHILQMQNDLHALTEQLSIMTQKMVGFQQQLAQLTREEIESRNGVSLSLAPVHMNKVEEESTGVENIEETKL